MVRKLPVSYEDEAKLINLFRCYGGVLAATVRKREGTYPDGEKIMSWAVVSFSSLRAAEDAVTANLLPPALKDLDVKRLDEAVAHPDTGSMSALWPKHLAKAEQRACIGTIISETPGASDVVGARCCAVRLYTDGRVLLVRRVGLEEMSLQDVEKIWKSEQVKSENLLEEVQSESASMARSGLLRTASLAVLSAASMNISSRQRHLQGTGFDEASDATSSDTSDAEKNVPIMESAPVSTTQMATGDFLVAAVGSDVEDEFTDLLPEHPFESMGEMFESVPAPHVSAELEPSSSDEPKSKAAEQQGSERPSRSDSTDVSPSLVPPRPAFMRTVHTPGATECHLVSNDHTVMLL